MKTTITQENFDSMKYKLFLSVSLYGKMQQPIYWNLYLSIYDFENESVIDMTLNYLLEQYQQYLKK